MIEVNHVSVRYGSHEALSDVTFKIRNGHISALVGKDGRDRLSLMNIMAGCLSPDAGAVLVNGYDMATYPREAKRQVGYLPSPLPLFSDMTPYEYLSFAAEAKGVRSEKRERHIAEVMLSTGLEPVKHRLVRKISEVDRRRVGIAQALCGTPDTLLLCDPVTGLDPAAAAEIRALIDHLSETFTILVSAPTRAEVRGICDHVITLEDGRVVGDEAILREAEEKAVTPPSPDGNGEWMPAQDEEVDAE